MTAHGVDRTGGSTGSATVPAVDSIVWNDVVFLDSSDSPYTVSNDDRGKLLAVDCSGGAVTINLPSIAALPNFPDQAWLIGIKKTEASGNAVTIARNGTDTIDEAETSKTLVSNNAGCTLVPDTETSPDQWVTLDWGPSGANFTVDTFSGDASDTTFELSTAPGTENNTFVYISGVYQQKSEYSVSGTTLTFSEAPPAGTNNIQVLIGSTLAIGVPGDGTVTTAKLVDGSVTPLKLAHSAVAPILLNGQIVASVAGNALTLALKTRAGTDPSASDPVYVVFKSATASSGALTVRSVTSALSITISSGSTLGHASGIVQHLFVYLIDNAGSVEIAVSNLPPDYPGTFAGTRLVSTTAEGGAGAADSATGVYSTTARASVPWLCIAMCKSNQATAGTWASVPSQIDMAPFSIPRCEVAAYLGSVQSILDVTSVKVTLGTEDFDPDNVFDNATNYRYQPNVAGTYRFEGSIWFGANLVDLSDAACVIKKNGTEIRSNWSRTSGQANEHRHAGGITLMNGTSDYLELYVFQASGAIRDLGAGVTNTNFSATRIQ